MDNQNLGWSLFCYVINFNELSKTEQNKWQIIYQDWNLKYQDKKLILPDEIKIHLIEIMLSPLKNVFMVFYPNLQAFVNNKSFDLFFNKNLKKIINNLLIGYVAKETNDCTKIELFIRLCCASKDLFCLDSLMAWIKNTVSDKQTKFDSFFIANFLKTIDVNNIDDAIKSINSFLKKKNFQYHLICPNILKILVSSFKNVESSLNDVWNRFNEIASIVKASDDVDYQCDYISFYTSGMKYFYQNLKYLKRYEAIIKNNYFVGMILTNLSIRANIKPMFNKISNEIILFTYLGYLIDKQCVRKEFSKLLHFIINLLVDELTSFKAHHIQLFDDKKYQQLQYTINWFEFDLIGGKKEFIKLLQTDINFVKEKFVQYFSNLFNQKADISDEVIKKYMNWLTNFKLPQSSSIEDNKNVVFENLFYTTIYAYDNYCFENNLFDDVIIKKDFMVKDINTKLLLELIPQEVIDKIPPYIFSDSAYLSVASRKMFSHYEYQGDLIYNSVIDKLKIDFEIIDKVNYYERDFQTSLCSFLDYKKLINQSPIQLWNKSEYSFADYFEAIVYFYYMHFGAKKTENWILNLIKKQYPQYIVSEIAKSKAKELQNKDSTHSLWYYSKNKSTEFNSVLVREEKRIKKTHFDRVVKMWVVEREFINYGIKKRKELKMKKLLNGKEQSNNAYYDSILKLMKADKTFEEIKEQTIDYNGDINSYKTIIEALNKYNFNK